MVYSEYSFSYAEYSHFLMKISDQSKYKNVTLNDFLQTKTMLPVISLRHDIDGKINNALKIAEIEYKHNIIATYFILHTAEYYGTTEKNYVKHNEEIIPLLKKLQDEYNHEIGWHNDLVTLDFIYGINPRKYLQTQLGWLRENGIRISGTAGHGSSFCHKYKYLNQYFFSGFQEPKGKFVNNKFITGKTGKHLIKKASLNDFKLKYDAYHLDNNLYYSDSFFPSEKRRWHPGYLNLENLKSGDKAIILTHPQHWHLF